jgi:hypothetical protein
LERHPLAGVWPVGRTAGTAGKADLALDTPGHTLTQQANKQNAGQATGILCRHEKSPASGAFFIASKMATDITSAGFW